MSTVFINGNFGVVGGRCSQESPQYYAYYLTSVQFVSTNVLADVEIHVFCPQTQKILQDCTVINLIGRLFAPSSGTYLIDAISMVHYPGNPEKDEDYESSLIDDMTMKIWAIGTVLNNAKSWSDGCSRIFNIAVSDYI
ncbi:hypothetical protein K439DRAFT_1335083 [Ramaria rubella]|nr:hypothetical protein K439DRAFT_1335083 [Ramaria rubella]